MPPHDMKPPLVPNKHAQSNGLLPPASYSLTSSASAMSPISLSTSGSIQPVPVSSVIPGMAGQKPRRPFPSDQVAEFQKIVSGSNLTKTGLVEVLKKRYGLLSLP